MKRSYIVGNEIFKTKQNLVGRVRSILYKYGDGDRLDDADEFFMLELLNNHPRRAEKAGFGIDYMTVERNWDYPTPGFYITRTDGTKVDFSFLKCIYPSSARGEFLSACRSAVKDDIIKFKRAVFSGERLLKCPITGNSVEFHNSHVDHEFPMTFERIADMFADSNCLDIESIQYDRGGIGNSFLDPSLSVRFADFHNAHARLRVVSIRANLSILKRNGRLAL